MEFIVVVICISILEMGLSKYWNVFYFTFGPVLYKRSFKFKHNSKNLLKDEKSIGESGWFRIKPTIVVKRLKNGDFGVREALFEQSGLGYSAVLRGHVKCSGDNQTIEIKYRLNWYYLGFTIAVPLMILLNEIDHERKLSTTLMGTGFIVFLFACIGTIIAATQHALYKKTIHRIFPYETKK